MRYERLFKEEDLIELEDLENELKVPTQNADMLAEDVDGLILNSEKEKLEQELCLIEVEEEDESETPKEIPAYQMRIDSKGLEYVNLRGIANELPDPSDILTVLDTEENESII